MEIEGHGAVVTGGVSGLGEAMARHLAALGADVTILDYDGDKAADVAAQIGGYWQRCDVSEEAAVAAAITSAMARFGQAARIVVNCAGIGDMSHAGGLFTESLAAAHSQTTPDAQEGLRAFLEKRNPRFR